MACLAPGRDSSGTWAVVTVAPAPVRQSGRCRSVVLKGSWNRADPTGYKVVVVPFKDGKPEGSYTNFMTGFWIGGSERAEVWGRPAAIAQTKDGALLIADDTAGTIWRVDCVAPAQLTC